MRIGIPAPARVRQRTPGPLVPHPADVYYGLGDFHRRRIRPAVGAMRRGIGATLPWIIAIGLALALRHMVLYWPEYRVIAVVVFVLSIPLFIKWVELTIIFNIIFISGLIAVPRPITVGGQGFKPHEIMVILGVAIAFYKLYSDRAARLPKSPITLPLVLFLLSIGIGLFMSWRTYLGDPRGLYPFTLMYNEVRTYFMYLTFFIFLYGIRTEKQLKRVLYVALGVCSIVGLLMVVQYFVGPGTRIFFGRVEALQTAEAVVTRTIPPGMALVLVLFPLTVYLAARAPVKYSALYILLASTLGLGLLFTFTRNWWLTSIISLLIMALLSRRDIGVRIIVYGFLVGGLAIAMSVFAGGRGLIHGDDFARGILHHFKTSFTVTGETMAERNIENRNTWARIKDNWLLGEGTGVTLRQKGMPGGSYVAVTFIHNCYLEIWLVYGLPGIVFFLWLLIAVLWRSLYIYRHARDDLTIAIAIAVFAGMIGVIIRAWVTMNLTREPYSMIAIIGMWGMLEAAWSVHQQKHSVHN
jgi:O-antigen ligase